VLLIDGNDAFREMLAALLTSAGCEVVAAASAAEAWRLQDESFDAVVSDIEAAGPKGPGVPGRPRGDSRWSQAALIALTTLPVGAGLRPGPDGGFAAIVRRADRRGLFDALERALGAPISAAA
jgi:two-component system chemotaxis sensor kinase CheA